MNKRIEYIDVARGIAMICIILGHLGNSSINRVVFTFHVPIFYFITGYFISNKSSLCAFSKKRAKALLIPYAVTCLIIMLSSVIIAVLSGHRDQIKELLWYWLSASVYGAGDSYTTPFVIHQIGAIWFLWASFWGCVILRASLNMKPIYRIAILLVIFFSGIWSRKLFWFPLSIQAGCCASLFMYIGYLIRRMADVGALAKIPVEARAAWSLFAAGVWVSFIMNFQSFWLVHCDMGRGIIDFFGCICACYCIIMLARYMQMLCERIHISRLTAGLAYLGRCSILILCIHIVELNTFPWKSLVNYLFAHGWPLQHELLWIIVFKLLFILSVTFCLSRMRIVQAVFSLKSV